MDGRATMVIPRIIHRIWLGGGRMPSELEAYGETFRRHHPDWEFVLWNERNLPRLRYQELFDRAPTYSQKSDFARYEVVHRMGGIYVDTDVECLRPLDAALLGGATCFVGCEEENYFGSAVFGAVPGHPLLDAMIEAMPRSLAAFPHATPVVQTGPVLLTRVLLARQRHGANDVVTFPSALFYPYNWREPHKRQGPFPEAYVVHHWAGSWRQAPVQG